jgi:hypothetical protein
LPLKVNSRTCYLSWHEAAGRDKGHQWMEELLVDISALNRRNTNGASAPALCDKITKCRILFCLPFQPPLTKNG